MWCSAWWGTGNVSGARGHCPPAPAPQLDHGEMTGWATAVLAALPPAHVRLLLTDPARTRTRTPGTPGHVAVTMPVAMMVAYRQGGGGGRQGDAEAKCRK